MGVRPLVPLNSSENEKNAFIIQKLQRKLGRDFIYMKTTEEKVPMLEHHVVCEHHHLS